MQNEFHPPPTSLPQNRVTLSFVSERGRKYLYDDITGTIFPWSELREAALNAFLGGKLDEEAACIQRQFGHPEATAAIQFVKKWKERYGAFCRAQTEPLDLPSTVECLELIRRSSTQLILVVTENCNLRCRYCAYSGSYKYNRVRSPRRMTPELAIHALDWFVDLVRPQLRRNPRKKLFATFYGGEPLLNIATIEAVLEHSQHRYPGLFHYSLTTNGVLLVDKIVHLFERHQVSVVVSLDGPQSEHDRERVDTAGRGTHSRILERLGRVREMYPQYWKDHFLSLPVVSYKSDLNAVVAFFEQNEGKVPRCVRSTLVAREHGTYWQDATRDDYIRLNDGLRRLRDQFKRKIIDNVPVPSFVRALAGNPVVQVALRGRLHDPINPHLPFTGTCFPGYKIAVGVDGTLNVCERVNGTFPIGHLDIEADRGIDAERVRSMIDGYQRVVLPSCPSCPVTRLCNFCMARSVAGGIITRSSDACQATLQSATKCLRDFVSIKEGNPGADVSFGTGRSIL